MGSFNFNTTNENIDDLLNNNKNKINLSQDYEVTIKNFESTNTIPRDNANGLYITFCATRPEKIKKLFNSNISTNFKNIKNQKAIPYIQKGLDEINTQKDTQYINFSENFYKSDGFASTILGNSNTNQTNKISYFEFLIPFRLYTVNQQNSLKIIDDKNKKIPNFLYIKIHKIPLIVEHSATVSSGLSSSAGQIVTDIDELLASLKNKNINGEFYSVYYISFDKIFDLKYKNNGSIERYFTYSSFINLIDEKINEDLNFYKINERNLEIKLDNNNKFQINLQSVNTNNLNINIINKFSDTFKNFSYIDEVYLLQDQCLKLFESEIDVKQRIIKDDIIIYSDYYDILLSSENAKVIALSDFGYGYWVLNYQPSMFKFGQTQTGSLSIDLNELYIDIIKNVISIDYQEVKK